MSLRPVSGSRSMFSVCVSMLRGISMLLAMRRWERREKRVAVVRGARIPYRWGRIMHRLTVVEHTQPHTQGASGVSLTLPIL